MIRRLVLLALTLHSVAAPSAAAQISLAEFAQRRARLLDALPDGVTLVLGADDPRFDYLPWQQARPLLYLTGFEEPGAALILVERGESRNELLFLRESNSAREVWDGKRLGVAGARTLGFEGRDITTLRPVLDSLLHWHGELQVVGDLSTEEGPRSLQDQFVDALRAAHPAVKVTLANAEVDRLRGVKSAAELALLTTAAEISARGHLAVMGAIEPGIGEYQIQALAEYVWRSLGADGPGYASIVGSGPNGTTLHYNRNDRVAEAGEVIVMDMAAQFAGYAADITRTVPVSGRFSPAQRELYTIVLDAQRAAERQVVAGGAARAMSDSANGVLRAGLARLGLIEEPAATYDCGSPENPRPCSQLSLYYMHGLGHGIGLDVHDPDAYYATGRIAIGSAFTVEPGVYVRANLLEIIPDTPRNRAMKSRIAAAVARYADIGVRIEDDYLVTGPRREDVKRASASVPREIDEIERLMAAPRTARPQSRR